uniref:Protein kinase domain-containing protein n=1 Tax=Hemiselmis andersenii TaxID=464988 RepID=A0A6U4Q5S4_HEMAN|mmetsp:Transcript_3059/g.7017  ORF Transcript_3059/g.7017 Transcript_3059/m.7017 type:complete len:449 (+) Transcript_3059:240-1586(+)
MGNPNFKIQKHMPEKHGALKKQGKLMKNWAVRYFKLDWQGSHAVLLSFKNPQCTGSPNKTISLEHCFVKANKARDKEGIGYCIEVDTSGSLIPKHYYLYAATEVEREEWVHVMRKHAVNSVVDNGYDIKREDKDAKLGSGSYSTVWKGVDRDTRKVWALKEMQKSAVKKEEEENLREEVRISTIVGSHHNVVYMKEFVENKDKYYIILEYLTGGELFDRIVDAPNGHFTERDAAKIMRQVMGALAYLHGKGIVHRDLKPENFLLADESPDAQIKIADFGFACNVTGEHSLRGLCGSPGYVAPEIIREKDGYGLPVDMWSMGVIFYILLTGIPPFAGDSDEESFAMTLKGSYDKAPLEEVSRPAKELVAKMLTYSPSKRMTAEAALQHVWMAGSEAPDKVLKVQENLRSWRARMRFKKAIIATVATTRLHAIMRRAAARPDAKPEEGAE